MPLSSSGAMRVAARSCQNSATMPINPSSAAGSRLGLGRWRKNSRLLRALNSTAIEKITDSSPLLM